MNTNRKYRIIYFDIHCQLNDEEYGLDELLNQDDNLEVQYSAQERTDEILDLKNGESMYFQVNRDNDNSKAVLLRIK